MNCLCERAVYDDGSSNITTLSEDCPIHGDLAKEIVRAIEHPETLVRRGRPERKDG